MADKPYYAKSPIAHVSTLAAMLEVNEKILVNSSQNTENSYTHFLVPKNSNKDREVCEPKAVLKRIQKRINSRIMSEVYYPEYLMGGIQDSDKKRDYINNSKLHLRPETLINLDIKDFFPNIEKTYVQDIFKNLFNFSDEVSEILACLTTFKDRVPQGGCTSTYVANLLFFNHEYSLVTKLRGKGISYSRLLDDITLSSNKKLTKEEKTWAISQVTGMVNRYGLSIHSGKTRIEHRDNLTSKYEVTGAWVRYGEPKIKKEERKKIRSAVHNCEKMYAEDPCNMEYHKLWNKTSGRVAQLGRFNHKNEERKLRERLKKILPIYNDAYSKTLRVKTHQLIKRKQNNKIKADSTGTRNYVLKLYHELGIMARTQRAESINLKSMLRSEFSKIIQNPYY